MKDVYNDCKKDPKSQWLIDLKSKGISGSYKTNFLWKAERICIMDNHRMALWCWLQFLEGSSKYNLFHLDAHYDYKLDPELQGQAFEKIKNYDLSQYQEAQSKDLNIPLIRWDNYLPYLFRGESSDYFRRTVGATQKMGFPAPFSEEISPFELESKLENFFVDELKWVFNLDFDYFFSRGIDKKLIFDTNFLSDYFNKIKYFYDKKEIELITVALSPECCGSWKNAEVVLEIFCQSFGFEKFFKKILSTSF